MIRLALVVLVLWPASAAAQSVFVRDVPMSAVDYNEDWEDFCEDEEPDNYDNDDSNDEAENCIDNFVYIVNDSLPIHVRGADMVLEDIESDAEDVLQDVAHDTKVTNTVRNAVNIREVDPLCEHSEYGDLFCKRSQGEDTADESDDFFQDGDTLLGDVDTWINARSETCWGVDTGDDDCWAGSVLQAAGRGIVSSLRPLMPPGWEEGGVYREDYEAPSARPTRLVVVSEAPATCSADPWDWLWAVRAGAYEVPDDYVGDPDDYPFSDYERVWQQAIDGALSALLYVVSSAHFQAIMGWVCPSIGGDLDWTIDLRPVYSKLLPDFYDADSVGGVVVLYSDAEASQTGTISWFLTMAGDLLFWVTALLLGGSLVMTFVSRRG